MTPIDENFIRSQFNIHQDVEDERIKKYLKPASRRLKKWVGEAAYADTDLSDELQVAEANIVMHFLLVNLNTAVRSAGMVKTEEVEGAKTVTYWSISDVQAYSLFYLAQAEEIIGEMGLI